MNGNRARIARKPERSENGSALTEFSAALMMFILFMFVPLLDCGIIPIRYAFAYGVLNVLTHRMALCEKVSQADQMLKTEKWWHANLTACDIGIKSTSLNLKVVSKQNAETQVRIPEPAALPAQWQPDANAGPYFYYLELTTELEISPLFKMDMFGAGLPGLTGPATIAITTDADWENLGRDSESPAQDFYLNE